MEIRDQHKVGDADLKTLELMKDFLQKQSQHVKLKLPSSPRLRKQMPKVEKLKLVHLATLKPAGAAVHLPESLTVAISALTLFTRCLPGRSQIQPFLFRFRQEELFSDSMFYKRDHFRIEAIGPVPKYDEKRGKITFDRETGERA